MTGLDGVQPQGPVPTIFRPTTRPAGGLPGDFEPVDLSINQSAAIETEREEERRAFTDVMFRVTKHSPSMQAEVRKLGVDLQNGVSREAIRKNLPAFQRAWQVRQVEALDLKNSAPLLYKDLANLEFASVAYDVVEDLSTFDRIYGDLRRDWLLNVRNKIGAAATGIEGRDLTDKDWAEIAAVEDEMEGLGSLDNYFSPALGFLGQQAETVKSAAGHVAVGAVAGSAVPALGTVAGAGWGLRVGYAANSYNVNSGGSYISMRRAGVSHQTARDHARRVGVGSTILEMAGARALTGVSPKKIKEALKRITQSSGRDKVGWTQFGKEALRRGAIGAAGETATETAQTAYELGIAEAARKVDTEAGKVHPETGEPITSTINDGDPWGEILDTAITTAQAMSILGPAAGGLRAGARFRFAKKQVDKTQEFYKSLGSDGIKTLAERAPDIAAEHIRKRVKDSPFDHLQVDVRDLRRVLGELGMDDKQIVEMLPDAERAFELAAEHPDMAVDVTVETGDFISEVVTRPEVYKALSKIVRAEGDFMSFEQLDIEREELAKMEGELVQAAEKADEQLDAEDAALAESQEGDGQDPAPAVQEVDNTAAQVQVVSKQLRGMISQAGVAGTELNEAVNVQRAMLFRQYSLEQVMERNEDGAVQPVAFDAWFEDFGFKVLAQNGYEVDGGPSNDVSPLLSESEEGTPQGFYRRSVSDSGMVERVITLVLQADKPSTLLHESAHLFFDARIDLLRDSLANPDKFVSPTVGQDIETLFDAMEVGDPADSLQDRLKLWDALTPDEIRPKHESVARNFERYMMAGDSPASSLDKTFSRISHWMTSIYGDAEAINTAYKAAESLRSGKPYTKDLFEMTPEVRQVFDRLFAAREDVRTAMRGVGEGLGAGFGEREDGDIEAAAAAEVGRRMVSDAVRQGLIHPKRVESRVGADARRVRKAVAGQELERARKEPVHRLRKFLATGEFTDESGNVSETRSEVHRLNTEAVRAMMPGSVRDYGSVTSPNGLQPREVASTFGYESATEMMVDLRDQPRIKEAVRERTQKRMVAEYSELATPIAIQNTIKAAIAGEASQAFIVDQIDSVLGRKGNSNITLQAARGAARRRIRKMQLRELRTDRFEQSARRNRRLARERWGDGDIEGAADAYRAELVDTATVREIARSRVTVENGERRLLDHFAASRDRARAKERDTRYLAVGRELLARVGLGPQPSKPGEATETLRRRDPEFYASIGSYITPIESFQTPDFRSLTWEQFEQVVDIGEMLWDRSKTQKFGELNQKRFNRNAKTEELVDALEKVGALEDYDAGPVKGFFHDVGSLLTRVEHAMIRLDGGERGVWWETMYLPVRKAFDKSTARQRKHLLHLRELLEKVDALSETAPAEVGAFSSNGEFDHVFGKDAQAGQSAAHELVALLVNLGTQSNRDRIMLGRKWSSRVGKDRNAPVNMQPMNNFLRRMVSEGVLRDEHFALAQGILDTYEAILPSFQEATLATQGIYANELEAVPLVVQVDGKEISMRGGYAPARYDESSKTKGKQAGKEAAQDQGLFFGNSATKDRLDGFSDVISLRLTDTMLAFQDHIRFAEVAPVAKQIRDLLEGGQTREGESLGDILRKTNPGIWSDHTSALYVFLSRATTGKLASHVREPSSLSRFLRSFRNSFGLLQFSFDVKNATENFSGLAQASAMIGPKWVAYGFRHQDGEFASKGNDFMANRLAEDAQQVIATDINPGDSTTGLEKKIAYVLPRWTQNIVDRTIWAGAYQRFMAVDRPVDMTDDKAHAEAVEFANSTVRQINSADLIDVGSYEGMFGEFGRLLTQWFSWANGQQQLTKTLWHKTMQEGGVGRHGRFAYRFMMQHWASYMVAGAVSVLSRDIPDDEEELERALVEGLLVEPLKFTVHAAAPIAGDVVTFGVSKAIGERAFQAGSAPSISKVQGTIDDLVGVDASTPKAMAELSFLFRNFLPPKLRAAAAVLGSSSRQIDYASKVASGDVEPTDSKDAVRGALTGKTSPESRRR